MAESFRFRNDSAISLCALPAGGESGKANERHHPHRTRRRPPSQNATAHACCPSPVPPQGCSRVAGRVLGCQLANRYAASPIANAVKRERISCSGAGAVSVPEAANSPRNLPQQAPYTSPLEQGQRSSWFSSVMPTSIKKRPLRRGHSPQQNGRSCFQSLSLSEPTRCASTATLIQRLREPGCQPRKAYPRMRRGT